MNMKRSGSADLPLHGGKVPAWLYERMARLGGAITEAIVQEYGTSAFLSRISDPFWFQSFGAVLGMDWHSSGITTSVLGALKKALNPKAAELGIYICGGKGKHSRETPSEILRIADQTGLPGNDLVHYSKLSAKIDNTAIQDGFQLYLHTFILTHKGEWAVVQQGMNENSRLARRYHWHSKSVRSFVENPHTAVVGQNQGLILNLTAQEAKSTREGILSLTREKPAHILREIPRLVMPRHHEVRAENVDMRRLGAVLTVAWENNLRDFKELLMIKGVGPRTIQSLSLVSEIIHGTPSRFKDPARFSFAHGGKDRHPFPVPTRTYDETISILQKGIEKAKLGFTEKQKTLKTLHELTQRIERNLKPEFSFEQIVEQEKRDSWKYGGRSVFGKEKKPESKETKNQLSLF